MKTAIYFITVMYLMSPACSPTERQDTESTLHDSTSTDAGQEVIEAVQSGDQSKRNLKQNSGQEMSNVPSGSSQGKRWWDNRKIYFNDQLGYGDAVFAAIKGQPYFTETLIFVYVTDKLMEGTFEYDKIEQTLRETRLDDRIFLWVHLDEQRQPIFVKKLISNNIKNKLDTAPLRLE